MSASDYEAFQMVTRTKSTNCSDNQVRHAVHFAFTMYAKDGRCDKEDINKILKDLGMQFDNPLLASDAIFGFLDRNHDDTITCIEFEQALEPTINKYKEKGWTLDITDILKDAFSRPIKEEKKEVELVDQAFLYSHSEMIKRHHGVGTFWGFKWLFRMYDDFYWKAQDERGHHLHPSMRLDHLKEHLNLVAKGDETWLNEILTISEHKREIPTQKARDGVHECATIWLAKVRKLFDTPMEAAAMPKESKQAVGNENEAVAQHDVDVKG